MLSAREANRRYFETAYRTGQHGWGVEEPSPYAVRFLKELHKRVPGGRLLDIGCGEGRHAIAARHLGFRVTAIDFEPLALRRGRRFAQAHGAAGIRFLQASALRLPFPASSFDIALDYGCLHHQRKADWPAYRASLLKVLQPESFYVLSVFSPKFRFFRDCGRPWHVAFGAYRRCFRRREIADLFGRDFEILEMAEERGGDAGFWHGLMARRANSSD
jgi:SAM-dependent methyltransferase